MGSAKTEQNILGGKSVRFEIDLLYLGSGAFQIPGSFCKIVFKSCTRRDFDVFNKYFILKLECSTIVIK